MTIRRILFLLILVGVWYCLRTRHQFDPITESLTQHPEWSDVEHHSKELLKSAKYVARDSVIKLLEKDQLRDPAPSRSVPAWETDNADEHGKNSVDRLS